MKELEVLLGIILLVVGAIVFEMGPTYAEGSISWVGILRVFGLVLLSAGVLLYVVAVDSLDEEKNTEMKAEDMVLRILPVK
ncbi:MAG: hypothetical protein NTY91_08520 [Euryarchaeota archaeon]|jgi:protein-S-isoprenylcysteine O-methyltransferase Ste14|nr:hypothetical protein [Euryarchaeota archaeon]